MNYLAHGYRFVDDPMKLAGTAVPDWLSVVDRKVRVRTRRINEHLNDNASDLTADERAMADGMLQHLKDDDTFHRSHLFMILESELSLRFRRIMPDRYDHRPPFLGHIVTELLLDSVIFEETPEILDAYYAALAEVQPAQIESVVNRIASRSTDQLVQKFQQARILYDYIDDSRLLHRLNQVLRRVTLPLLDEQSLSVLRDSRVLLRLHGPELLQVVESPEPVQQLTEIPLP